MGYSVKWTSKAVKQLLKISKRQRILIVSWVKTNLEGCDNPKSIPGSKKIEGSSNGWRYRVGSYRVLVSIHDAELLIEVVRVGHRQGIYEHLDVKGI